MRNPYEWKTLPLQLFDVEAEAKREVKRLKKQPKGPLALEREYRTIKVRKGFRIQSRRLKG